MVASSWTSWLFGIYSFNILPCLSSIRLIEIGFDKPRTYPSNLSQGGDEPPPNIEFPIHYSKEPPYGGQNLPPQLGYSQNEDATQNNPTATSISKKQKRSGDLFQNLGKNNNLGEGEFID